MAANDARTNARGADRGPLRGVLVQSWRRSAAAHLDRDGMPPFRRVPADELQQRQTANRILLDIALPHLQWLSEWFRNRPHVVYLADADGVVLHSEGDVAAIARYRLAPGYDWSERLMGTNGAGTALASAVPVAVVGCDHWSTAWKDATCLGAPILDRTGHPIAAIDISMDAQDGDAERLVVVAHVAYTIAQELARFEAEAQNRATARLYETARAALDAERRARAEAEAASARTQAVETELRHHEARLQTIIDSTPALVYVVDQQGRVELINRLFGELFSIDPARVAGTSLFDHFPADVAEQFAANNQRVLEEGAIREFEESVTQHGTDVRTYISVKAPLFDGSGTARAVCGVSTDITERKRLSTALELAQRHKDAFIATVAHELRQPIGAIQAAVAVMQARISREQGERARAIVERQVGQLARIVEDLLDATRVAQGKVTLERQRTALQDVIDAAVQVVQADVAERRQTLAVTTPADAVWLDADAARLQQVFSNLLTNAVKFTPPEGRIEVVIALVPEHVRVIVRDTGAGIPADVLPNVFEMFTQATADGRGLGIGLAVVRVLVERHGGTVEAHSEGAGRGSAFVVTLPLADPRA
jgi:PAS domain S-box-containing protein